MDRERIRENKVFFRPQVPTSGWALALPTLCLKYRRLGPTPDLLNQNLGELVPGIWISESLHSWFCWVVVFLVLLCACCPVLGVLSGWMNQQPVGCYYAGHRALVPRFQSLAMAQLPSTSQAAALKEGKRVRPSQQRGSLCTLLVLLGVVALLMVSRWPVGLLWCLAEPEGRLWPGATWNGLFLFCWSPASGLWVAGSAFSLRWVSLQSASQDLLPPHSPSLKDAYFIQSSLLKWSLIWGRRCPTEIVKSILVSWKCYSLPKCPLDSRCQVPWSPCKIRYLTLLAVPQTVNKDECPW